MCCVPQGIVFPRAKCVVFLKELSFQEPNVLCSSRNFLLKSQICCVPQGKASSWDKYVELFPIIWLSSMGSSPKHHGHVNPSGLREILWNFWVYFCLTQPNTTHPIHRLDNYCPVQGPYSHEEKIKMRAWFRVYLWMELWACLNERMNEFLGRKKRKIGEREEIDFCFHLPKAINKDRNSSTKWWVPDYLIGFGGN